MPALFALITLGAAGYASASTPAPTTDHDSVVVGRRMFTGEAWVIDDILDWAAPLVAAAGFTGVVLGSEVTGRATAWMAVFAAWVGATATRSSAGCSPPPLRPSCSVAAAYRGVDHRAGGVDQCGRRLEGTLM
jgi:hypothetical protein